MRNSKKFTGKENHSITTAEAVLFIKNYHEHFGAEAQTGCFFDRQAVRDVLAQPDVVGMRYYYGVDDFGQQRLVLVGAKANRDDVLDGKIVKTSIPNPPLSAEGVYDKEAVDHEIGLQQAAELTASYRAQITRHKIKAGFFGREAIHRLLDYPACVGLRFFFGAKKDGVRVVVMMCVDKSGADLFYGPIAELSALCPPFCPGPDILNQDLHQAKLASV